ncbi:MAG: HAD family hydrolase [Candidatus Binatia bacterium]
MERLILDIDGTLIRSRDGYLPFNEAIRKTFGVDGDIRAVVPDGNTDPLIVEDIFVQMAIDIEISASQWRDFTANLRASYHDHLSKGTTMIHALPGALELLQALSAKESFVSSVVTGNFEVTAQVKLDAAGLARYLRRGAYASDSSHRPDLPAIAKRRWEDVNGGPLSSEHCVIIGDTPKDLDAARQSGMKCILVGTGRYPIEELLYWEPDGCIADLSDTQAIIALL